MARRRPAAELGSLQYFSCLNIKEEQLQAIVNLLRQESIKRCNEAIAELGEEQDPEEMELVSFDDLRAAVARRDHVVAANQALRQRTDELERAMVPMVEAIERPTGDRVSGSWNEVLERLASMDRASIIQITAPRELVGWQIALQLSEHGGCTLITRGTHAGGPETANKVGDSLKEANRRARHVRNPLSSLLIAVLGGLFIGGLCWTGLDDTPYRLAVTLSIGLTATLFLVILTHWIVLLTTRQVEVGSSTRCQWAAGMIFGTIILGIVVNVMSNVISELMSAL